MTSKQVQVANRLVVVNTIKWADWEDLCELKKERVSTNQFIKACLNKEDAEWWAGLEYDPDNKEVANAREEILKAVMEVNPRHFASPKAVAGRDSTGASGAPLTGSPSPTDGL